MMERNRLTLWMKTRTDRGTTQCARTPNLDVRGSLRISAVTGVRRAATSIPVTSWVNHRR